MRKIKQIILHGTTSDHATFESIRRYHLSKKPPWSDIGYHYVIDKDGTIHRGRGESKQGAGVRGLNTNSIHICRIGRSRTPITWDQQCAIVVLFRMLLAAYPDAEILGHRECNRLLPSGLRTRKKCPGSAVDMDHVRFMVSNP